MWLANAKVTSNQPSRGQDKIMVEKVYYACMLGKTILKSNQLGIYKSTCTYASISFHFNPKYISLSYLPLI